MKKFCICIFLLLAFFVSGQTYYDVVYLKSGNKVTGLIMEQIPNDILKIQTGDGSIFVFKYSEIEKITKEFPQNSPNNLPNGNNILQTQGTSNYSVLQNGTPIFVKILNEISSASDDMPNCVINGDIKDNLGRVLIANGSKVMVECVITKRKAIGRPGKISIRFISTYSTDGQIIMLTGNKSYTAEDKKGRVIGIAVGIGTFLLPPMYAFLAKKGDDIILPAGTLITSNVTITGNYSIK